VAQLACFGGTPKSRPLHFASADLPFTNLLPDLPDMFSLAAQSQCRQEQASRKKDGADRVSVCEVQKPLLAVGTSLLPMNAYDSRTFAG